MSDETSGGNTFNINAVPSCVDEPVKALLKPSADELGGFFGDLLSLVTGKVHFTAEKRRIQQEHNLQVFKDELNKKLEDKPEECLVEPHLQVVGPAIESAKFCLEEPQISEMFQNLLANAADERYQDKVHPSFPAMISQMSPLDAQNIALFDKLETYPIVRYKYEMEDSHTIAFTHCFLANSQMTDRASLELQSASLSSLERQGLVTIDYSSWLTDESQYQAFENTTIKAELNRHLQAFKETSEENDKYFKDVAFDKGVVRLTPLGKTFISVCFNH